MRRVFAGINFAAMLSPVSAVAEAAVKATEAVIENRRKWRRDKRGRKPDNTAEPQLKKDAPWTPREKDGFANGHSIRYWTGRYWSEEYARSFLYASLDEAEAATFTLVALDPSLMGELEIVVWTTLSKPVKIVHVPAPAQESPPRTMIVSKPKR